MLTPNAIQQLIMHIFYYSETLWHFFFWNCKLINNHSMFKWPMLKAEKEMLVLKVFYCWLTNYPRRQLSLVGKHLSCEILQNQDLLLKSNEFKCYGFLNFVHTKGWVKKKKEQIIYLQIREQKSFSDGNSVTELHTVSCFKETITFGGKKSSWEMV